MRLVAPLALALVVQPALAAEDRNRPLLDGTVQSHASGDGHFRIWYTLDGGDAITALSEDQDPINGVPDAVDVVEEGLVLCWELFVDQEGWRPPGDDEGEGGDSRLDVYLRHIDNNGLASYEWHTDHWASYLQIEPELAEMGGELMASVAAHEFHHAIQYSYTVDTHTWVHEASATYAQYRIYSDSVGVAAALQLLWGLRLEDPGVGLDTTGDRQEYAGLVWVKFLVDRAGGDLSVFRLWWEILAEDPDSVQIPGGDQPAVEPGHPLDAVEGHVHEGQLDTGVLEPVHESVLGLPEARDHVHRPGPLGLRHPHGGRPGRHHRLHHGGHVAEQHDHSIGEPVAMDLRRHVPAHGARPRGDRVDGQGCVIRPAGCQKSEAENREEVPGPGRWAP